MTIVICQLLSGESKDECNRPVNVLLDPTRCQDLSVTFQYTREQCIWSKNSPLVGLLLSLSTTGQPLTNVKIVDKVR